MADTPNDRVDLKEILDLDQLKKLLMHFSVVTGLDAALFNQAGQGLAEHRKDDSICVLAQNCPKCREYISYGGSMSRELGEPYIYACGCGLIMCSSPILFNDGLAGSIACGRPALGRG
jgi:ligand-binding sensor protein